MNQPAISRLKPMNLWLSLLFFGIPAGILYASVYLLIPAFESAGLSSFMAYMLALGVPLLVLLVATFVAYRLEGNPPTWAGLVQRFRLHPVKGRDWFWVIGLTLFCLLAYGGFSQITRILVANDALPLPDAIPGPLDPRLPATADMLREQMGGQLVGNWGIIGVYFVVLFLNIIGEEFWWRGYVLPRQELAFGRWTWVLHGIMWCLFHAFKWWDYFGLLPVTLAISYVAQRKQNTTPGIIAHYVINGLGWVGTLLLVLGVGS